MMTGLLPHSVFPFLETFAPKNVDLSSMVMGRTELRIQLFHLILCKVVAKSMESIISETVATPSDPRRKELERMEMQKAIIDQKAKAQVRGELYFGLGFLTVQTLGFMRLTFWELSWDVMEPICFFVSSLDFALAYGFFLRTSTEPTFEGYFHRRFKSRQNKLIRAHNFDEEKYNHLRKLFYPAPEGCYGHGLPSLHHFKASWGNVSS